MHTSAKHDLDKEIQILTHILDVNQDAKSFYAEASKKVQDAHLKTTFQSFYQLHSEVGSSLRAELAAIGATFKQMTPDKTLFGKANQLFGELISKLSSNPDIQLISRLERAEDRCLENIEEAIIDERMSSGTRKFLDSLRKKILANHDQMKFWKQRTSV
jgi:uncharacterized protein (TIGR02284 family)